MPFSVLEIEINSFDFIDSIFGVFDIIKSPLILFFCSSKVLLETIPFMLISLSFLLLISLLFWKFWLSGLFWDWIRIELFLISFSLSSKISSKEINIFALLIIVLNLLYITFIWAILKYILLIKPIFIK